MGHPCLVASESSAPTEYRISLKDLGPLTGFVDSQQSKQLKLFRSGSVWDLKTISSKNFPEEKRVSILALDDFQLSPFRKGDLNRVLLSDWILSVDPQILNPKANADFLDAWKSYQESFTEEFAKFQDQRKLQGYTNSAELYFSKSFIQQGLQRALEDPSLNEKLQALLSEIISNDFKNVELPVDEVFYSTIDSKEVQTSLKAQVLVQPKILPHEARASFEPNRQKSESAYESLLGHLTLRIPIVGVSADVQSLSVQSDVLPSPYKIGDADDLFLNLELNKANPFEISISVIWNKILQRAEMRIDRKDIRTPFETMTIKSFEFRGKKMDQTENSPTRWVLWNFVEPTLNKPDFLNSLLLYSTSKMTAMLTNKLPFREKFVVMQNTNANSAERYQVELFQAGLAAHDPGLNQNLVARFQMTIPIVIEPPEVDLSLKSVTESLAAKIGIKILNPDVELENLELFWKGKRLSSDQVGFRFRMMNRADRVTKLDAKAELSLSNELSFKLDQLSTNVEGLSIRGLDVRVGNQWLKGDRPSLDMILDNIDLLRRELVQPKALMGIGERLQTYIEGQIRKEFAARLSNLKIPLDIKQKQMNLKADVQIPNIPIQDVTFRLRDWKTQGPTCKGTYLMSAEAYFGVTSAIPMIAKDLNIQADYKGLSAGLSAGSFIAQLVPQEKLSLQFAMDLCLSASRETIDFGLRPLTANFKNVSVKNLQFNGLQASNAFLDAAGTLLGLGFGNERDNKAATIVEGLIDAQKEKIFQSVGLDQSEFISAKIKGFLDSAPIRGEIERKLIEVGDVEERVTDLMYDLGRFLKGPLEKIIVQNLTKITDEYLPKANQMLSSYQSVTDQMMIHIGRIVGEDLESLLYSRLMEMIYGKTSRTGLMARLSYILEPSSAVTKLKAQLGLPSDFETSPYFAYSLMTKMALLLDECPFVNSQAAWARWNEVLSDKKFTKQQSESIRSVLKDACDSPEASQQSSIVDLSQLFEMGLASANKILLDESVRHFFALPSSESLPLRSRTENLDVPVEISKMELVPFADSAEEIFRVIFYSRAFSNRQGLMVGAPSNFVQKTIQSSRDAMVFRLHRETLNDVLRKIDWAKMLRSQFPTVFGSTDTIDIKREPYMTEDGRISFNGYVYSRTGKARLIVTPFLKILASLFNAKASDENLNRLVENKDQANDMPEISVGDVAAFSISFLDLSNPFGVEAEIDGSIRPRFSVVGNADGGKIIGIQFEQMNLGNLNAGVLTTPIKRRLDVLHESLNRMLSGLLSQVGEIPSMELAANVFSLDEIRLDQGNLYVVIGRSDSSLNARR